MTRTPEWKLWGWTPAWHGVRVPMQIEWGSKRDCNAARRRFEQDYPTGLTAIYAAGDVPEGLRLQIAERLEARTL